MSNLFKVFAVVLLLAGCGEQDANLSKMVVKTSNGDVVYNIETATTQEEMSQGLMNRKELRADSGMIFDVNGAEGISMWMKDTYISLDMIFVNKEGKVIWLYGNAEPLSTTLIEPKVSEPIAAVVEINGGDIAKHNIQIGDFVEHKVID